MTDPLSTVLALEGVPSAYAAARDGIDVMLRDRGLRRTSPETTAESLLRGAHASAVLEGSSSTLAQVRAGEGDEIADDSLRVSTELLGLAPMLGRSPLQALARLHALAAAGSPPRSGGRPRDAEAAARLRDVASLLTADTSAPALLVAGARARRARHGGAVPVPQRARGARVERLVLVARGVDEKSLVVPEAGHLALRRPTSRTCAATPRAAPPAPRLGALRRRGVRRRCRGQPAAARATVIGSTKRRTCRWHPGLKDAGCHR